MLLKETGLDLTTEQTQFCFDEMDNDKCGDISLDEFRR